jgi:ABC-type taurine transport system substrate-binding protein
MTTTLKTLAADQFMKNGLKKSEQVNKAPKLEGADRKDLMKLLEDYKTYLEVFEEAGADGMEPRPLKTMIKSCLLKANLSL